jgi:hypothetical protein
MATRSSYGKERRVREPAGLIGILVPASILTSPGVVDAESSSIMSELQGRAA